MSANVVYPNLVRISFQFGGISEHGSHIHTTGELLHLQSSPPFICKLSNGLLILPIFLLLIKS